MKSLNAAHTRMVLVDTYKLLMDWVFKALAIFLAIYVVTFIILVYIAKTEDFTFNAYRSITSSAQAFMIIVGFIIGYYAIKFFLRQGFTRVNYFAGTAGASALIAITIQLIALALALLFSVLEGFLPLTASGQLPEYLGEVRGYTATMTISSAILFIYFLQGWAIGFSFYRYNGIGGFIAIASAILVLGLISVLWGQSSSVNILGFTISAPGNASLPMAMLLTMGILALLLAVLFLVIRRSPVKVQ